MELNTVENIEFSKEVEVLVVGGGPAGVSAAFASARMGAKTLIVEQFNCLGGVATAGGHGHICLYSEWGAPTRVVGGVTFELAERVTKSGFGVNSNNSSDFEVEGMKYVLEEMAEECNCDILYYSFFSEAITDNGKIVGAVIQNKTGREFIKADRVIDCTGDGDVAYSSGCSFEYGDEETSKCQPVTLMFTIGGVKWDELTKFRQDNDINDVWLKAQDDGFMRPFQKHLMGFWWTPTRPDQVGINFTHINDIDSRNADDLTAATIEGRKQAYESIAVFKKYLPGMENCYMVSTPNTVGIRESRRISGEYTLSKDDVMNSKPFEDSIGYGSFFIDIHGTQGPGMDKKTWRPPAGFKYQIPYRITVPKDIDNLLVAGRCASCDHEALGSLRVMPQCGVMGQATGAATVISIRKGITPREVDIKELQAELKKQDCLVDDDDIAKAN